MIPAPFTISKTVFRAAGATITAAAMIAIAVPGLSAQRRGAAAPAMTGMSPVELSLRLAERLELTQEQRDQLEAVRVAMLEERTAHSAKLMSLQSEVRAGIRERTSVREEFSAIREEAEASRDALRDRYDRILTAEQKRELRQVTRRAAWRQGAARGRAGGDRWRGQRGRAGMDRWRGQRGRPGMDRWRGQRGRPGMDRWPGQSGRAGVDRWRGQRSRPAMDEAQGRPGAGETGRGP